MIEYIKYNDKIISIIIRNSFSKAGIEFFTPKSFSQQLAYMKHKKGHTIQPHIHKFIQREVVLTQEVLLIRKGKVQVDFFNDDKRYIESSILNSGDVILLAHGGHGFSMIEESEIIEVKQGPYSMENDKVRFEGIKIKRINIKKS